MIRGLHFLWVLMLAFCACHVQAQSDSNAALWQAKVMTEAGRYQDAVALLKNHEPADKGEELAIHVMVGKIYLALERHASALDYFEQAFELDVENLDAVLGAATASVKLGNFKQARQYLDMAKDIAPASAEPVLLQAIMALRTGDAKKANTLMSQLVKGQPESASVAIANARFLKESGDQQAALRSMSDFIAKYPQSAQAMSYAGELAFSLGNRAQGLKQKQTAYLLYQKEQNPFQRDVQAAWLQANGGTLPELNAVPVVRQTEAPKAEVVPPEPVVEKPALKPAEKPQKPLKANALPKDPDKELSAPVVRFPFPEGVTITGGSGFVVDEGKKIVTNRHVIEGGKAFAIRTGLGEVIQAKLIYVSTTDDLAVLSLDKPLPAERAIPSNAYAKPRVGRNVVVMGYPLWFILGQGSPSLTTGVVSKRTGMADDQATFQLTAKVNKGNSGGPVFDMTGNVVGITVGKLDSKKIQDEQGFMPEDVNFAIHVDRLPALIHARVEPQASPATELSSEELYQVMLGKVVMVATYK